MEVNVEFRKSWVTAIHKVVGVRRLAESIERIVYNRVYGPKTSFDMRIAQIAQQDNEDEDDERIKAISKEARRKYCQKIRSIYSNLTNPNNPRLLKRLKAKELTPVQLVSSSHRDMFPELWEKEHKRQDREMELFVMQQLPEMEGESVFQCRKCKQRKVQYTQLQTRSADESMTIFCYCTICEARWRA
jgi:transcription elongation factor S-II